MLALAYWIDYGFVHWDAQASWRIPVVMQCFFCITAFTIVWFLPDTPRWYYARGRIAEGDTTLARLNNTDVIDPFVQETKNRILKVIEIDTEASKSLHWKQFLTMGVVDHTRLKVYQRLVICFWLPMLGE